jgi:ammonia channel protein AmtB
MISTALAIQEATADAVIDLSTMMLARSIHQNKDSMTEQEFANALFEYSAHLSAMTATLVTGAILTKAQLSELTATIKEMDAMGKDAE